LEAEALQASVDMIWEASLAVLQLNITASLKQPRQLAEEVVSKTPDAVANQSCRARVVFFES